MEKTHGFLLILRAMGRLFLPTAHPSFHRAAFPWAGSHNGLPPPMKGGILRPGTHDSYISSEMYGFSIAKRPIPVKAEITACIGIKNPTLFEGKEPVVFPAL
jgi:hypothetical protein